jgi:hypothetical protein
MIPNENLMRATFPEERFPEIPLGPSWASVILSTEQTGEDRNLYSRKSSLGTNEYPTLGITQYIFWEIDHISTTAPRKGTSRTACIMSVAGVELGNETPVLGAEKLVTATRPHRRPQRGDTESSLTLQNHWKQTGKT